MQAEVTKKVDQFMSEWDDFKKANDERIKEIEAKGHADPLLEEKVNKQNEAISTLEKSVNELLAKMQRPGAGDPEAEQKAQEREHAEAFKNFMQKGKKGGLEALQAKGVSVSADDEGGWLLPQIIDSEIEQLERDATPMRQVCRVISINGEGYSKIVNKGGVTSGWVDEQEARPATSSPTIAALTPSFGEVYSNIAVTQKALDDLANIEQWLSQEVADNFAQVENDAFTRGDGDSKPRGILNYPLAETADATRAFGTIEKVHSGSSGTFVPDKLLETIYKLHPGYRQGAAWMMSNPAIAEVRKLKDTTNQYLWQPNLQAGQPASLMGYPILENEDVPAPAADSNSAIFGNFRRGYHIVDVRGVRFLRDELTNKPKVMLYTTKRIGGHVVNDRALKVYRLSA